MSPTMPNTNLDPHQDMLFLDDFESSLEALYSKMRYKYSDIRNLDHSLLALQNQNKQRCEQEIEEMKKAVACGRVKLDKLSFSFSNKALEEQNHCLEIADAKISLALDAYDSVDEKIQQLDDFLIQYGALRSEGEASATIEKSSLNVDTSNTVTKSGRGIRKKYKLRVPGEGDVGKLHTLGLQLDLPVDPNEPTYCVCQQVSFGKMVACDNPACPVEWFHFGCVGLDEQPKGKWFCSDCARTMKRGKRK